MKDNYGKAGFFGGKGEKRGRGQNNREESASSENIVLEALNAIQDYMRQTEQHFPQIQSYYSSLTQDIRKLNEKWLALNQMNSSTEDRYISELTLLRKWGKLCPDIDTFCTSLRQWKEFADNSIEIVRAHMLKRANSDQDPSGFIKEDAKSMEKMLFAIESAKAFIHGEMTRLKYMYKDARVEVGSVNRALAENPKLHAWASPFLNNEEDALSKAVATIKLKH